ncbi:hypothetical protein [Actinomadura sp. KC216]|uniref:hypothetical protein n=1 Tax=Actinomadura sp. KC216 TaxID=2530370 RepID=UPI001404B42F|nr:hypothetical protein [Actinomadura sp. KC216]
MKPEFWTDGVIVQLSPFARLFYQGTWNFACDRGHLADDPVGLKLKILPADDVDPEALIAELIKYGRIERRVTADGRKFLHVKRLPDHQKVDARWQSRCPYCAAQAEPVPPDDNPPSPAAPSQGSPSLPETPASDTEPPQTSPQGGIGGDGKGEKKASPSSSPRKRGTRIPDDFTVTAAMVEWARHRCPHVDGRAETEKFVNYWRAKSGKDATKVDWPATWRNWMLNAAERTPTGRASPSTDRRQQATDDQFQRAMERAQAREEGP